MVRYGFLAVSVSKTLDAWKSITMVRGEQYAMTSSMPMIMQPPYRVAALDSVTVESDTSSPMELNRFG